MHSSQRFYEGSFIAETPLAHRHVDLSDATVGSTETDAGHQAVVLITLKPISSIPENRPGGFLALKPFTR